MSNEPKVHLYGSQYSFVVVYNDDCSRFAHIRLSLSGTNLRKNLWKSRMRRDK